MNTDRRAQLAKMAQRRLVSAFQKVLKRTGVTTIEVEMHWPPDDDAIHFQAQADHAEVTWDFSIPTAQWQLPTDPDEDDPEGLYEEVQHLFRTAWKEARSKGSKTRAYLRFHDSSWSVDLHNGHEINDRDRPDYQEPARQPFSRTGRSSKKNLRNGELIRRGHPVSKVKTAYGIAEDPDPKKSEYSWPDRGIRIEIREGKVHFAVYFPPFPDCICGIWIGAHAWEVDEILGRAMSESFFSTGRLWQYDVDGFMSVSFDRQDRVTSICR